MQSVLHQTRQLIASFSQSLRLSKKTILLILAVASITLLISTTISILLTRTGHLDIPSLGTIKTLGVEAYWDQNLTDKIDEHEKIDWGTLWIGSSNNVTIYLQSISNIPTTLNPPIIANLTFNSTNQTVILPPQNISKYMNLTWDYDASVVSPHDSIQVTLTLRAEYSLDFINYLNAKDINSFNLDILISTTEYAYMHPQT